MTFINAKVICPVLVPSLARPCSVLGPSRAGTGRTGRDGTGRDGTEQDGMGGTRRNGTNDRMMNHKRFESGLSALSERPSQRSNLFLNCVCMKNAKELKASHEDIKVIVWSTSVGRAGGQEFDAPLNRILFQWRALHGLPQGLPQESGRAHKIPCPIELADGEGLVAHLAGVLVFLRESLLGICWAVLALRVPRAPHPRPQSRWVSTASARPWSAFNRPA